MTISPTKPKKTELKENKKKHKTSDSQVYTLGPHFATGKKRHASSPSKSILKKKTSYKNTKKSDLVKKKSKQLQSNKKEKKAKQTQTVD